MDGRPKRIELYGVFKRKGINLDGALEGETTTLHVHHTVLYISLPFLQDYQVKMAIFKFLFLNLDRNSRDSTPGRFAYF